MNRWMAFDDSCGFLTGPFEDIMELQWGKQPLILHWIGWKVYRNHGVYSKKEGMIPATDLDMEASEDWIEAEIESYIMASAIGSKEKWWVKRII